jgi:cysteine synthase A|tara:strand:- start:334 stop:1203 length:870 start_codon:yes stop_codon:yes gene_type:complete
MITDILDSVGFTPLLRLNDMLYAKFEAYNPTGSIKDRMVHYILTRSKRSGQLKDGDTIIEASSGNTGISISMMGAVMDHKVIIVLPQNMSEERKQMIRLFGATIIEVGNNDFKGALALRDKLLAENEDYFSLQQFSNQMNIDCHRETTAQEIASQILVNTGDKRISAFISGAGTGGTVMGVQRFFKSQKRKTKFVLVVPDEDSEKHGIQGIGDGGDYLVDRKVIDQVIRIKTDDATDRARRLARENGLLVGISSGANVLAAEQWIKDNKPAFPVVTILPDRGERYLSLF